MKSAPVVKEKSFFREHILPLLNNVTTPQTLIISQRERETRRTKVKFRPSQFTNEKGNLLTIFANYYGRHKTAKAAAARSKAREEQTHDTGKAGGPS
jgi:hypothetical protein